MALRRASRREVSAMSSDRRAAAGPSSSGNLRYTPSWPLPSNQVPDRQPSSAEAQNIASAETHGSLTQTGLLSVATPSIAHHQRQTSIQLMGIPRPEDVEAGVDHSPEEDQTMLGRIKNRKRANSRLVFRDNTTGKLYQCDNFVEIDDSCNRNGQSQRQGQAEDEGQHQQQRGSPSIPVLQLENSDGTFTLLDEAASSTDTIVTPFPSAPPDNSNSETSSHHEPGSRDPQASDQASPAHDQEANSRVYRPSQAKLMAIAALLIAGLPSLAGSFATVMVFKKVDRNISAGVVGWFVFSNILLAAGVAMSLVVYVDYRKARLAGMVTDEWYEMEDQSHNARRATEADQVDNGGRRELDHHAFNMARFRELEARNAQLNQPGFMIHAIEQASSRVAMPATSLSRPHIHTRFSGTSGSQATLHPSSALDFHAPPITPSTSNASIITTLCAGVAEPYSPLGINMARQNDSNPQEPEFGQGCRR